jgi:hypothetical protein
MQYNTRGQIDLDRLSVYNCAPQNEDLHVVNFGPVTLMTEQPERLIETLRDAANRLEKLVSERDA